MRVYNDNTSETRGRKGNMQGMDALLKLVRYGVGGSGYGVD
ncbi:hypothetical protein HM1_0816 [Heliomicrobium modesticaldum Ice1]|uniref:Uncharacterized protein n=1 Tax=Heliobacterium modesticaldum (strain ATCC 51547 / Ice1) TaxID=498761 RepID=B0TAT9_HELMI|nr:hypothetical protein HM1_0816 [Heliomicrobium modesticaldum Ice1]